MDWICFRYQMIANSQKSNQKYIWTDRRSSATVLLSVSEKTHFQRNHGCLWSLQSNTVGSGLNKKSSLACWNGFKGLVTEENGDFFSTFTRSFIFHNRSRAWEHSLSKRWRTHCLGRKSVQKQSEGDMRQVTRHTHILTHLRLKEEIVKSNLSSRSYHIY